MSDDNDLRVVSDSQLSQLVEQNKPVLQVGQTCLVEGRDGARDHQATVVGVGEWGRGEGG